VAGKDNSAASLMCNLFEKNIQKRNVAVKERIIGIP
jgi:hypothetical protein